MSHAEVAAVTLYICFVFPRVPRFSLQTLNASLNGKFYGPEKKETEKIIFFLLSKYLAFGMDN